MVSGTSPGTPSAYGTSGSGGSGRVQQTKPTPNQQNKEAKNAPPVSAINAPAGTLSATSARTGEVFLTSQGQPNIAARQVQSAEYAALVRQPGGYIAPSPSQGRFGSSLPGSQRSVQQEELFQQALQAQTAGQYQLAEMLRGKAARELQLAANTQLAQREAALASPTAQGQFGAGRATNRPPNILETAADRREIPFQTIEGVTQTNLPTATLLPVIALSDKAAAKIAAQGGGITTYEQGITPEGRPYLGPVRTFSTPQVSPEVEARILQRAQSKYQDIIGTTPQTESPTQIPKTQDQIIRGDTVPKGTGFLGSTKPIPTGPEKLAFQIETRRFSPDLEAKLNKLQSRTSFENVLRTIRSGSSVDIANVSAELALQSEQRPAPKTFRDLTGKPQNTERFTEQESKTASEAVGFITKPFSSIAVGLREIQQFVSPTQSKIGQPIRSVKEIPTISERTERAGKFIPEIATAGLAIATIGAGGLLGPVASKAPLLSRFLPSIPGAAFTGYQAVKTAKNPSFENVLTLAIVAPVSAVQIAGAGLQAREIIGAERVPVENVFAKEGLVGGVPEQSSVASTIKAFQKGQQSFPENENIIGAPKSGVPVSHARSGSFPTDTKILRGERGDPGLFVTTRGRASYRFTGLQKNPLEQDVSSGPTFTLLPRTALPRVLQIRTAGVDVLNKAELATQSGFEAALAKRSGTGKVVIPSRGFAKGTGLIKDSSRVGTPEEEGIISENTRLSRIKNLPKRITITEGGPVALPDYTVIVEKDSVLSGRNSVGRSGKTIRDVESSSASPFRKEIVLSDIISRPVSRPTPRSSQLLPSQVPSILKSSPSDFKLPSVNIPKTSSLIPTGSSVLKPFSLPPSVPFSVPPSSPHFVPPSFPPSVPPSLGPPSVQIPPVPPPFASSSRSPGFGPQPIPSKNPFAGQRVYKGLSSKQYAAVIAKNLRIPGLKKKFGVR